MQVCDYKFCAAISKALFRKEDNKKIKIKQLMYDSRMLDLKGV